ncbi:MAG TPA: NADH dehydrogenase (quinone) subunit D [candidate division Zixibacteria bacterium]|nr:NADH dehydrogenase (quinone) subunit D [candidate division Zixibacteria bacterium]MDD4917023.1 NADH dehydrogenase (quinone) subunit D [candidate division Zixibacteria bacterium]MDM7971431.1 NADH dehydrogenase (quinone) subunit D [candidate division Zixibacteria bacterium]HOD66640.1 NADH dehydrogenase (quinone) subunit D [candidate division Zixibacteria bacterium]HOZ07216.1 NADH dehydrogenase (quinone) subunit D [candidate division Zixibacteria bacterium]
MAEARTVTINMGPQHPSTHGVLRVILELDGETVVKARPVVGYLHTGIEKTMESKLYYKALPCTDRMDYLAPMSNNLGYSLAVEKLLGIEVPEKVKWARVILAELTRINSHLVWLGTHALDLGAMSMLLYAFRERELILDVYEACGGQRMMTSYIRIGGLAHDLPKDFDRKVRDIIATLTARLEDYEGLLTRNEIFINRTKGVAVISAEDALNWSLSGPMLRGSGVARDLRKDEPYSGYENFDFQIALGHNGDAYDRYLLRMEEIRQSLRICRQGIDGLPEGPYRAHVPGVVLPPKEDVLYKMESMIFHFKIITEGFAAPLGSVYQAIESPKGELGFYVVGDGTTMPRRIRVRPPSLINLASLPRLVEGRLFSDVICAIGSIDIVLGEVDR